MSHAQIWDDSALIDTWNEALSEYKKYHSIHLKGGVIERETRAESEDDQITANVLGNASEPIHNVKSEIEVKKDSTLASDHVTANERTEAITTEPINSAPILPQHLVGSVQDEGLKNLLMSWYYAGYYTGLHEGQQQTGRGT